MAMPEVDKIHAILYNKIREMSMQYFATLVYYFAGGNYGIKILLCL